MILEKMQDSYKILPDISTWDLQHVYEQMVYYYIVLIGMVRGVCKIPLYLLLLNETPIYVCVYLCVCVLHVCVKNGV